MNKFKKIKEGFIELNKNFVNNKTIGVKIFLFLLINLSLFFIFFGIYCALFYSDTSNSTFSYGAPMTIEDILYFSAVTHTTTGYGDILPESNQAKNAVSFHIFIVILFNILFTIVASSIN